MDLVTKFNTVGMPFNFKKLLKRDNFSGHVNYSAPELIQEQNIFSNKVDIWSLGCCIYYLLAKKDPFDGRQPSETKNNILSMQFSKNMKISRYCQDNVNDRLLAGLMTRCLSFHQNQRPSCAEIVNIIDKEEREMERRINARQIHYEIEPKLHQREYDNSDKHQHKI